MPKSERDRPERPADGRLPGLAARTLSFLGEVITGKVKSIPREAEGSLVAPSTFSPVPEAPPPLSPVERDSERAEAAARLRLYQALKDLLDQEPGRRKMYKPLWALEQNIRGLGARGLDGMAPAVVRQALAQLDETADYSNSETLWQVRDLLIAKNAKSPVATGEPGAGEETDIPAPPVPKHTRQAASISAPPARREFTPPVSPTPTQAPAQVQAPVTAVTKVAKIPLPSRQSIHQVRQSEDAHQGNLMSIEQPEVTEVHGLGPFPPQKPKVAFSLDTDTDLPTLRRK